MIGRANTAFSGLRRPSRWPFHARLWGKVARDAPNMTLPCLARSEPSLRGRRLLPPFSPCFRESRHLWNATGCMKERSMIARLSAFLGASPIRNPKALPSCKWIPNPKADNHNARYHVEESWGMGAWCYAFVMQQNPCQAEIGGFVFAVYTVNSVLVSW